MTLFAPNNEAMKKVGMGGKGNHEKTEQMRQIMEYHLLPQAVEYKCFGQNSTVATELHADDGSFGGYRRRLEIESTPVSPRTVTINGYSVITQADIRASNGKFHRLFDSLETLTLFCLRRRYHSQDRHAYVPSPRYHGRPFPRSRRVLYDGKHF